ncbi:MAG: hypothetical protein QMD11_04690 [Smithella sp.]|nr:hypothetical protein [Smithella sp.]
MMIIFFLTLTALCILISLIRNRKELSRLKVVETILLYMLFINVGLSGLMAFYGHAFLADKVAASIGWPTGSPFQFEVAVTNLAFGVLGVLCVFFRDGFWLATGIGYATFLFGAAYIHIKEIITEGNYAVNNAGPILYIGDIAIPLLILTLLLLRWKFRKVR